MIGKPTFLLCYILIGLFQGCYYAKCFFSNKGCLGQFPSTLLSASWYYLMKEHRDRPDMWPFVWFNVTVVLIISYMTMHLR